MLEFISGSELLVTDGKQELDKHEPGMLQRAYVHPR